MAKSDWRPFYFRWEPKQGGPKKQGSVAKGKMVKSQGDRRRRPQTALKAWDWVGEIHLAGGDPRQQARKPLNPPSRCFFSIGSAKRVLRLQTEVNIRLIPVKKRFIKEFRTKAPPNIQKGVFHKKVPVVHRGMARVLTQSQVSQIYRL